MGSVERNLSGKSEKVEHFSLLDGTFLVGISGLGGRKGEGNPWLGKFLGIIDGRSRGLIIF